MLSSDYSQPGGQHWSNQHSLTESDSFDITFMPRSQDTQDFPGTSALTPRQREMRGQLELPELESYPRPPGCSPQASEEESRQQLLELYQGFALDLHTGMYLTQLMVDRSYSDIHCQLMEDMATLKLDQSNGRIIEFPLANVSKVYRLAKIAGKLYSADRHLSAATETEQIIVVVFSKRKLAFVFKELRACQRFATGLELLIWRAQQLEGVPLLSSGSTARPLAPVPQLLPEARGMPCPTPRLARDSDHPPRPPQGDCKGIEELPHGTVFEDASSVAFSSRVSSRGHGDGRTANLMGSVEQVGGRQRSACSSQDPPVGGHAVAVDTQRPAKVEVPQADEEVPCAADSDFPELTENLLNAIACVHAMEAAEKAKQAGDTEAEEEEARRGLGLEETAQSGDAIARENATEEVLQQEASGEVVPI